MTLNELRKWLLANTTEQQTVNIETHWWANSFDNRRRERVCYRAAVWVNDECIGYAAETIDALHAKLVAAKPGWHEAETVAALDDADALCEAAAGVGADDDAA